MVEPLGKEPVAPTTPRGLPAQGPRSAPGSVFVDHDARLRAARLACGVRILVFGALQSFQRKLVAAPHKYEPGAVATGSKPHSSQRPIHNSVTNREQQRPAGFNEKHIDNVGN